MTDLMHEIFCYISDNQNKNFLPGEFYWRDSRLLVEKESALLETFSDDQKELFESYQLAAGKVQLLELEAMFQAAWAASRELA